MNVRDKQSFAGAGVSGTRSLSINLRWALVLIGVMIVASASGDGASQPGRSKLGIFDLGRDEGRTVRTLIDTARLPFYRTVVEKANEMVPYYKERNPQGVVMVGLGGGIAPDYTGDPRSFARVRWETYLKPELERIRPEVRKMVDYFAVGNNLSEPRSVKEAEWWSGYAQALCAICTEAGIKPLILSSGVGCLPCGDENQLRILEAMLPGLRAALACKGGWSCGAFSVNYTMDLEQESKYSLRYRRAYEFFRKKAPDLLALPMVLSEGGIDRSGDPNNDGYAARGSKEKYAKWLRWFDAEIKKDGFIRGGALFAIGTGGGWKSFDLEPMAPWLKGYWTEAGAARVEFARDFAPSEGWTKPVEEPYRQDLCLNGSWQFQPVAVPKEWKRGLGTPPELPLSAENKWEATRIKIPSPWNVNTWGAGRNVGPGSPHPYWPSSVYYPSYPAHWDGVEMGWLKRSFRVPGSWKDRRIVLHFEAIGGHAQVFVNGRKAGEHFDRFLPFELDVTDLVKQEDENELLVGVRSMRLYDQKSATYKHMRTPYPPGSNTDNLTGIWQDVFLLGLPQERVADVFVKPWVDRDTLEVEVALRNDSRQERVVTVDGAVQPWVNLAGAGVLHAPEPKWRLDPPVLEIQSQETSLKPGETKTVNLSAKVSGRLRLWSPAAPNLYALVLSVSAENEVLDRQYTRFGWRQCKIAGQDFLLNGQKVQMFGDLLHPFGPFVNSRRYVWAWYRMIKDMHGNAVRPHAQPHPRHYLDLADEMGLLVLDETAMFGSSLQLNFEAPAAWERYAEHYDNLIRRDRNHPSVFGWSWGNELFAIFIYDKSITREQTDAWYRQLAELGNRGPKLDPTRDWFSCDGDEDVRGTMPIWNKHFGHGVPHPDWLPKAPGKPLMVGESGGSYYARPEQLAVFNGSRAYESYRGRNEALAIDVYENIVKLAIPRLAFFSPAETAWFGVEHLNLGYHGFKRLPTERDGVWCKPFEENKPGVQPERIPPYVCTFNPGWDPSLPLYKPLPMFEAQKAAQHPGGPQPCPWERKADPPKVNMEQVPVKIEKAGFAGARDGELWKALTSLGLQLVAAEESTALLIIDAATFTRGNMAEGKGATDTTLGAGGTVWVMFTNPGQSATTVNELLPGRITLTSRSATALVPREKSPWTAGFSLADIYFAEDAKDKQILKCGLDGELIKQGRVLLEASNTDWSVFNGAPENAKCAAVVLYEQLQKPAGNALVTLSHGGGTLALSSIDVVSDSPVHARFWKRLFAGMGVRVGNTDDQNKLKTGQQKPHDLLLDGPPAQ